MDEAKKQQLMKIRRERNAIFENNMAEFERAAAALHDKPLQERVDGMNELMKQFLKENKKDFPKDA